MCVNSIPTAPILYEKPLGGGRFHIWAVSSVRTTGHQKTSKQDWERLRVPSPNSVPSADQNKDAPIQQQCKVCSAVQFGELASCPNRHEENGSVP